MKNLLLYITVFTCGAAVLAIEMLGTRIIGPFYGVSLFLWSALISITLIALSTGYIIGGRIADKTRSYNVLALIILISGIIVIIIPFIRNSVISITSGINLRAAVLISAFILFFPPLTLLGMISPYAVRLRIESISDAGKNTGDLYAVSTIGSVLAALATGFILIPNLGIMKLTISVGIILILLSILLFTFHRKPVVRYTASGLIIMLLILLLVSPIGEEASSGQGITAVKQSTYAEIKVLDQGENRYLLIDGGIHSAVNKNTQENILPYVWVLDLIKHLRDYSGDMLLIGLGGGSVQKSFYNDNWDVETVEIDPIVTEIAREYFHLDSASAVVYHADGRDFLQSPGKKYDAIILDAFGSSSIPFHLITMESFQLTKLHLKQDGILAINVESLGWDDEIVTSVFATLKQVYQNAAVLPIAEPPSTLGNVIIIASQNSFQLTKEVERNYNDPYYRFSAEYEMAHAWDNMFTPDVKEAVILTDDLNPVDIWAERINLQARIELHKALGETSFLW